MVMAHGGTPEWNASVLRAVGRMGATVPTAVAFGMADPTTLARGLDSLKTHGAERVAVVRLFVSGRSFYPQTAYLLGLSDRRPEVFATHRGSGDVARSGSGAAHGRAEPAPLVRDLTIATHMAGMMGSAEVSRILMDRARGVSRAPARESVLLIAHGMGQDEENRRLMDAMDSAAEAVRGLGFARVGIATLREDWPEARARAEREIREFVASEGLAGRRVLVLPYRLSGFGPYAGVLEGLDYVATEGFLPHPAVSRWIRRTAEGILCEEGWLNALGECGS